MTLLERLAHNYLVKRGWIYIPAARARSVLAIVETSESRLVKVLPNNRRPRGWLVPVEEARRAISSFRWALRAALLKGSGRRWTKRAAPPEREPAGGET